jgi:FkbM family methyltransferase
MISTTTLTIVDGVRIVVPDSLNLITPYVLMEQRDWFEDEIKFLRHLIRPGQKVIDIGANYGVYTLSMAQVVGPGGCVWAFEPATNTARLLAEGIAVNGFSQIILEPSALSNVCGTAKLLLNENSELNSLVHGMPSTSASETVPLVTLDECMERYGWRDIEFMKIDAEGEECNIIKGGERFFKELSPLVQYEIKAGTDLHMELIQNFAALGYDSYRLVPGLNLLVPFDAGSAPDGFLLNLFCCKRDRIERLAAQGYLLNSARPRSATWTERFKAILKKITNRNQYDWRNTIAKLPYGIELANSWKHAMDAEHRSDVDKALSLYALSRDASVSPTARFGALESSFSLLKSLCERQPSYMRLASLARVARDFGARSIAINALKHLSNDIIENGQANLWEPFLAPGERFDSVPTGEAIGNWALASVLEEFERLASFSSFYTGISAQQRLEMIRDLGFGSAEMNRRLRLLKKRFALPSS